MLLFILLILFFILILCIFNKLNIVVGLRYYSLCISLVLMYCVLYMWFIYQSCGSIFYIFDILKFGNIYIYIGFDTLSLSFISLTVFLTPFCIFFGYKNGIGLSQYSILLLILCLILIYIFLVLDIILFYILFESILVPLFILIGLFGSRYKKLHSSILLYSYTIVGSFIMIIVLLFFYMSFCSSFFFELWTAEFSFLQELFLFILLFISFSIKIPLFPVHLWLPEAHVEASTEGSVILAGVLLKLGGYAMLRFIIPIFSNACITLLPLIYVLCIVGMFYVCMITLRQTDLKRIIAYSSIGHMSLVVVALYTNNIYSIDGSLYVMLSHGLISGALFFCVGYIYEKYKTRQMHYYYDIVQTMPIFSFLFFIFILGNIAFPGIFSFVGELYMLVGILNVTFFGIILTLPSLFITTVYTIGLYSRIVFGYSGTLSSLIKIQSDVNLIDLLFFMPFIIVIGIWGIYPPSLLLAI
jgi:proton-translocating NADH-quinone oxidoreductase chain M